MFRPKINRISDDRPGGHVDGKLHQVGLLFSDAGFYWQMAIALPLREAVSRKYNVAKIKLGLIIGSNDI